MKKAVQEYISARDNLFSFFRCRDHFPVRIMTNSGWCVKNMEGMSFLACFGDGGRQDFAVVKKDGEPMVFANGDYTMVVAIDCIKTAFVFKNTLRV